MNDRILEAFLRRQEEEGRALAAESDLLLLRSAGSPPDRYVIELKCNGLVEASPGDVVDANHFVVGIRFPPTYLRVAHPFWVLTWLGPHNVWHPNISATEPFICIGNVAPGTELVDLIYGVFEVVTWNRVTMREDDALNAAACQWARQHRDRYPVDRRPLKRQPLAAHIEIASHGRQHDGQSV
jgi:hypothetical protein